MKTKLSGIDIQNGLAQFTGSECLYQTWMRLRYTEGVKWLVDSAEAYWLLDVIGSHLCTKKQIRGIPFLVARLEVKNNKAVFTMHEDWNNDKPKEFPAVCKQNIPYTDFPLDSMKLYCVSGTVMLPSEY
jgi:hypothetical protein